VSELPLVQCLSRFSLTTADADKLALFYEKAFNCRRLSTERSAGPEFETLMGVSGGALRTTLSLGGQIIELLQFDQRGRPYPPIAVASDLIFQHFAIVVSDMAEAYRRLSAVEGWTPISRDGPQLLPASSGRVAAFKFRDPEGHPLEFLAFPRTDVPSHWQTNAGAQVFEGIDHSAISVSDTARSISFYETLGFAVSTHSLNLGGEQESLDDVAGVRVEVTALAARQSNPHLELLGYSKASKDGDLIRSNADIATTRLVFAVNVATAAHELVDPDGHHLLIEGQAHWDERSPRGPNFTFSPRVLNTAATGSMLERVADSPPMSFNSIRAGKCRADRSG
jgi:catechol 2,3-dioxygenase-like lactoylglutathione lyase family enzyme